MQSVAKAGLARRMSASIPAFVQRGEGLVVRARRTEAADDLVVVRRVDVNLAAVEALPCVGRAADSTHRPAVRPEHEVRAEHLKDGVVRLRIAANHEVDLLLLIHGELDLPGEDEIVQPHVVREGLHDLHDREPLWVVGIVVMLHRHTAHIRAREPGVVPEQVLGELRLLVRDGRGRCLVGRAVAAVVGRHRDGLRGGGRRSRVGRSTTGVGQDPHQ